ncbi:MAG: hypothetical protein RIS87_1212 [Pseudomonadota bacterium]
MFITTIKQSKHVQNLVRHMLKVRDFFPAIFFFGGFAWDAFTIGRNVAAQDLFIFAAYLATAGLILYLIGRPSYVLADSTSLPSWLAKIYIRFNLSKYHWPNFPYFLLQFIYGNLLSSLFILYFKSASHWLAWLMSLLLGAMLVGNEYLEDEYKRFTLSWALFGFCAMLLFNFALPFLIGSIHPIWFYLSTLMGLGAAHWLYKNTPNHFGSIVPVWLIAAGLMFAYAADMIPPVPLVKRDIAVAYSLNKVNGDYQLSQQPSDWWVFWRKTSTDLEITAGQRVYCISSVFAPSGLNTKLYHRWQFYDKKQGWVTQSHIGFTLAGGRYNGFRGYTYKQNLQPGQWRVAIETESEKTVAVYDFRIKTVSVAPTSIMQLF